MDRHVFLNRSDPSSWDYSCCNLMNGNQYWILPLKTNILGQSCLFSPYEASWCEDFSLELHHDAMSHATKTASLNSILEMIMLWNLLIIWKWEKIEVPGPNSHMQVHPIPTFCSSVSSSIHVSLKFLVLILTPISAFIIHNVAVQCFLIPLPSYSYKERKMTQIAIVPCSSPSFSVIILI